MAFRLGHSSADQNGINKMANHATYSGALRDLLSRGVTMKTAHDSLKRAQGGSHVCAIVFDGKFRRGSCEVIFIKE